MILREYLPRYLSKYKRPRNFVDSFAFVGVKNTLNLLLFN